MYPASKLCGELLVNTYADLFDVTNIRFFFIYGKGQNETMLIPRLFSSIVEGTPIKLQGENGLLLNPVYAIDAAQAVNAALNLEGANTINVAGKDIVTLREVGEMIGSNLGLEPCFELNGTDESPSLVADISKMTQMLGLPQVGFKTGISDYCRGRIETTL